MTKRRALEKGLLSVLSSKSDVRSKITAVLERSILDSPFDLYHFANGDEAFMKEAVSLMGVVMDSGLS